MADLDSRSVPHMYTIRVTVSRPFPRIAVYGARTVPEAGCAVTAAFFVAVGFRVATRRGLGVAVGTAVGW